MYAAVSCIYVAITPGQSDLFHIRVCIHCALPWATSFSPYFEQREGALPPPPPFLVTISRRYNLGLAYSNQIKSNQAPFRSCLVVLGLIMSVGSLPENSPIYHNFWAYFVGGGALACRGCVGSLLLFLLTGLLFSASCVYVYCTRVYVHVTQVTVFKSLTNLIIITGDYFWHNQVATPLVLLSLAVMTGGAILASLNDIEFS